MTPAKPLRAATALATSLALVLPPMPLLAQDATVDDALREQCASEGVQTDELLRAACVAAGLLDPAPSAAAPEAEPAPQDAATEQPVEAPAADQPADTAATEPSVEAPAPEQPADAVIVDEPAEAAPDAPAVEAQADAIQAEADAIEAEVEAAQEETGVDADAVEPLPDAAVAESATETVEGEGVDAAPADPAAAEALETLPDAAADGAAPAETAGPATGDDTALDTQAAEGATGAEALQEGGDAALVPSEGVATDAEAPSAPVAGVDATAEAAAAGEPCPDGTVAGADGTGCVPIAQAESSDAAIPESEIADNAPTLAEADLSDEQREAADQASQALSAIDSLLGGGTIAGDAANAVATEDAAPVAAAATDATPTEEVDQEITTQRTASEEFATSAIVTDAQEDEDDDGFSRDRKILLGALGALAVGTVLANRARVVSNSGDRVVVQRENGDLTVLKDDDALLRQAGSNVRTESFDDGSTRTIVTREDGSQIITVRDASLRVLRRVVRGTDGQEYTLIDDTRPAEPVRVDTLPLAPAVASTQTGDALGDALRQQTGVDRRFSLAQVRQIPEVRSLAPAIEVAAVTFESGSAAIQPDQAQALTGLAQDMIEAIGQDPRVVFLIEGHTDATGDAALNLALSDRRAESLALALNEYFAVPVENMVVQGYGERYLKIPTQAAERANRRAVARNITNLLQTAAAN